MRACVRACVSAWVCVVFRHRIYTYMCPARLALFCSGSSVNVIFSSVEVRRSL